MLPCPPTAAPSSCSELQHAGRPIRCYKIGNGRRSYNAADLRLTDGCGRTAAIQQCIHAPATTEDAPVQESSIAFHLVLPGRSLLCRLFLVYDVPQLTGEPGAANDGQECVPCGRGGSSAMLCNWRVVTRADCARGCKGALLATSRRLSGLGKRQLEGAGPAKSADGVHGAAAKGAKQMFVSIDEACTHCGASAFRLVAAIYAQAAQAPAAPASSGEQGTSGAAAAAEQQHAQHQAEAYAPPQAAERLLAAAVSPPIKVLANNDTPTGPGRIPLEVTLPANWEGWQDPAVWCANRDSLESSSALLPASGTPPQPRRLVRSSRSEPCTAGAADSGSAGSKPGSPPAAAAAAALQPPLAARATACSSWPGTVPDLHPLPAGRQLPQQPTAAAYLRSSTPVLMAPQAQSVMAAGTTGTAGIAVTTGAARHGSRPLQGRQLPSAEAAEAAVAAAWRQRQQARQSATAESPLQPLSPLLGSQFGSQSCGPAAAQVQSHQWGGSAALPPLRQPAVTAAASLAGAEAMLAANGRAIVTRVPGGYRVVRMAGAPGASPSPFALRRSAQGPAASSDSIAAASYGSAGTTSYDVPALAGQSTPADCGGVQWSATAPLLPRAAVPPPASSFAWAEQQCSAGSAQQGTQLLTPESCDVAAAGAAVRPPLASWPPRQASMAQQVAPPLPAGTSLGSSGTAMDPGSWGAMQWAAYQSAVVRQVDIQLVTAGLAAAGRLGLLPSAAPQQAPAAQPAWHSASTVQGGQQQTPGPAAGAAPAQHGMPDLPSEAQLLSLMTDDPSEFDSMRSIFDDILPHERRA